MDTYKEKLLAMPKSYDETIDEVVKSDVIHPFPDVKPLRYTTYRARSKRTLASASFPTISSDQVSLDPASLSQSSTSNQITNTVSCSHHDSACVCVSEVRENKNLKGKNARDYREQMFKKAKYCFVEFYGLFRFFDSKIVDEKRIFTSLKQERFDFLV
jgi:hypothetical protein